MVWTLFVLDFDGSNFIVNPTENEMGKCPEVYLIPLNKQLQVESAAYMAGQIFLKNNSKYDSVSDIFEGLLDRAEIPFKYVGDIKLTYKERAVDYLPDYIPREIV